MKSKKKKIPWQQYAGIAVSLLLGAALGVWCMRYFDQNFHTGDSLLEVFLFLVLVVICFLIVSLVAVIAHEAGHLVFGLLSGYRFSSFRIFSFMWIMEDRKLHLKRLSIAGTGGQCLMVPPDVKEEDGSFPVILYNLGGALMNVITGLFALGLYCIMPHNTQISIVLVLFTIVSFLFAAANGIPMRLGVVDNDGYNAFSLGSNHVARREFWVQLKVNSLTASGIRVKDMPEELFTVPSDEDMKNSMAAVMGVFACNRLMDEHRFAEADALMEHMLGLESGMVDLHRGMLICDRIYVELISENRKETLDGMLTKQQKAFVKQMKTFPSVLRTEYAYALLVEKDTAKADQIRKEFDQCAKSYPYPNDIQSERELMEIARNHTTEL